LLSIEPHINILLISLIGEPRWVPPRFFPHPQKTGIYNVLKTSQTELHIILFNEYELKRRDYEKTINDFTFGSNSMLYVRLPGQRSDGRSAMSLLRKKTKPKEGKQ
jgi:hypothetical protein